MKKTYIITIPVNLENSLYKVGMLNNTEYNSFDELRNYLMKLELTNKNNVDYFSLNDFILLSNRNHLKNINEFYLAVFYINN